jgi:hypothetical protein
MTLNKERIDILKKAKETAIKAREKAKKARAINFKQELQKLKPKPKPKYEYETEDEDEEDECLDIFENKNKNKNKNEEDQDEVTLLKKQNELNTEIKDIVNYINGSINCLVGLHMRQLDKRKICYIEIVEDFYHSLIDIIKQFDKIRALFLDKSKLYNKSYIKS